MITSIEQFNELANLINTFSTAIPEGVSEELDLNGIKISLSKNDGKVQLSIESEQGTQYMEFDDTSIKEVVKEFKQSIDELDDNVFLEVLEEIKDSVDIKRFDELLNLEDYNEELAHETEELMDYVSQVICAKLQDKIQGLVDLYEKF